MRRYPFSIHILLVALAVHPSGATADETSEPISILVLPFEAVDESPDDAWVGRAIAESLAADLSIDSTFKVTTKSPAPGAGDVADAAKLGTDAGASVVLFGTFRLIENDVRITGRIVDAASGEVRSAIKATGPLRELFALQDSLAQQATRRIRPKQPQAERPEVARPNAAPARDDMSNVDDALLVVGVRKPELVRRTDWFAADARAFADDDAVEGASRYRFSTPYVPYYSGYYFGGYGYAYNGYYGGRGFYGGYRGYRPARGYIYAAPVSGWGDRVHTRGYGMVGGAMRATQRPQPYQFNNVRPPQPQSYYAPRGHTNGR